MVAESSSLFSPVLKTPLPLDVGGFESAVAQPGSAVGAGTGAAAGRRGVRRCPRGVVAEARPEAVEVAAEHPIPIEGVVASSRAGGRSRS